MSFSEVIDFKYEIRNFIEDKREDYGNEAVYEIDTPYLNKFQALVKVGNDVYFLRYDPDSKELKHIKLDNIKSV